MVFDVLIGLSGHLSLDSDPHLEREIGDDMHVIYMWLTNFQEDEQWLSSQSTIVGTLGRGRETTQGPR